jgi:hypothetical protein
LARPTWLVIISDRDFPVAAANTERAAQSLTAFRLQRKTFLLVTHIRILLDSRSLRGIF